MNSSKLGFHAAYVQNGPYIKESGVGNAVVGAYLTDMGLNLNTTCDTLQLPDLTKCSGFRLAMHSA